jgi:hypothetical protein
VDGLHIDDYFYPYPVPGVEFDDEQSFRADPRGFTDKGDWRRDNVNRLIEQLHHTIRGVKPWVKFGISPFGIYRNRKSDPEGSLTNGMQNYDDLYADILLWIDKGWVDYTIPQVYWEIGHKAADYETLVNWWAEHANGRPLFIGQDVMRTVKAADAANPTQHQQARKMQLQRSHESIGGSCQWPASSVAENAGGYATALTEEYHRWLALQPEFPFIDDKAPKQVKRLSVIWTDDGPILCWTVPKYKEELDRPVKYVVYRFVKGEKVDLNDATKITEGLNGLIYGVRATYDANWQLSNSFFTYNPSTGTISETSFLKDAPSSFSTDAIYLLEVDEKAGFIYVGTTDYQNTGTIYTFDKNGKLFQTFDSGGINPSAMIFVD